MLINLCGSTNDAASLCGRLLGAGAVLQTAGQKAAVCKEEVYLFLTKGLKDDRPAVKTAACRYPSIHPSIHLSGYPSLDP